MSRIRYEKGLVCFLFALAPQPEKDEREVSAYSWCMLVCLAGRRLKLKTKTFSGSEVLVLRTPVWAGVRKVARQLKPGKCGLCSQGTNSYVQRQTTLRVSSGRKDDSCKKITVSIIPECVSTGRRLRQSIRHRCHTGDCLAKPRENKPITVEYYVISPFAYESFRWRPCLMSLR